METKTTTEQSYTQADTIILDTNIKRSSLGDGTLKALAILGAIAIIYVGTFVIIQGVLRLPKIGNYLATVFLSSKKVVATTTPISGVSVPIVATTTTKATSTHQTIPVTPVIKPTNHGSQFEGGTTPGTGTTNIYPSAGSGSGTVSNPNGTTDLAINILSYGTLDKSTNVYTATTSPVNRSDRIAIRFEVTNRGNKTSSVWRFNGYLPTNPAQTFNSDEQSSINPGDKIQYTLGFDQMQDQRSNILKVEVDPSNSVIESNKTNNIAQITIPTL
jgi:subtilase family serine protease